MPKKIHFMINFPQYLESGLQLAALQGSQFEYKSVGFYPTLSLCYTVDHVW